MRMPLNKSMKILTPKRSGLYLLMSVTFPDINRFTPDCAKSTIDKFSKITKWVKLKNKNSKTALADRTVWDLATLLLTSEE